jgi:hypothetical protein
MLPSACAMSLADEKAPLDKRFTGFLIDSLCSRNWSGASATTIR